MLFPRVRSPIEIELDSEGVGGEEIRGGRPKGGGGWYSKYVASCEVSTFADQLQ